MNEEAIMRIAIIGAGSVGGTLGQAWLKQGEDVVWGLRNARRSKICRPTQGAGQTTG
jgi:predicted dinucleotide-binding enzyme